MSVKTYIDPDGTVHSEKEYVEIVREKYTQNPPAGYTSEEIQEMGDEDLLDMDYFLNE